MTETHSILREISADYPAVLRDEQLRDVSRVAFHISLLDAPAGGVVADIGGGIGLFSPGAAALGFRSILVDDFGDPVNARHGEAALAVHRSRGVEVISRDVIADGVDFAPASLDAVTTFDSIEHWHNSPKRLLHQLFEALKPGGLMIIGAPNCVNLRKRISVPLGRGAWSGFDEWYNEPQFRGHVREPSVNDLRHIAADLGLQQARILGRNWQGRMSRNAAVRLLTRIADKPLRLRPSLCADIYVAGRKPV